jgi:hypothetical protein
MGLGRGIQFEWGGRRLAGLAVEGLLFALLNETLPDTHDRAAVEFENLGDVGVGSSAVGVRLVGKQQDAGVEDLFGRCGALACEFEESVPLGGSQTHMVLVTRLRRYRDTLHGRLLPSSTDNPVAF